MILARVRMTDEEVGRLGCPFIPAAANEPQDPTLSDVLRSVWALTAAVAAG